MPSIVINNAKDPYPLLYIIRICLVLDLLSSKAYAGTLGLDLNRFKRDLDSEEVRARVAADAKLGTKLGISMTPTIFVNNLVVPADLLRPEDLHALVEAAVKAKTSP